VRNSRGEEKAYVGKSGGGCQRQTGFYAGDVVVVVVVV